MIAAVPLKRRAVVAYGLGQPPPLSEDGVPIIRATNIYRGRIVVEGLIRAALRDLPLDRAPLLRAGEVLVVRSGAYTGDSALITSEWEGAAPGYDLRLSPGPLLEPRFLAYSLLGQLAGDQIALARARAAQPHLNAEDLGEVTIADLDYSAQQVVADFLDRETARIDALIAKKQRLLQVLEERFAVACDALIWGKCPTAPLRHFVSGITVGIVVQPASYYVESGTAGAVPAVRAIDTKPYSIQTTDLVWISAEGNALHRKSQLRAGDVVVVRTGNAGAACVVPSELEGANCISNVIVRCSARLDSTFIEAVLNSARAREIIAAETVGAIQQHFGVDAARQFLIPDLNIEEQRRRVAELTAWRIHLKKTSTCITRQIDLLREHRQALITAAVSGELEVPGVSA